MIKDTNEKKKETESYNKKENICFTGDTKAYKTHVIVHSNYDNTTQRKQYKGV